MSRDIESPFKKFLKGLIITLLVIGTLVAIGFILNATIPAVHDFFVKCIDWVKGLFEKSEEVVEDTTAIVKILKE